MTPSIDPSVDPVSHRTPLRVAQIITTMARGGAQATVVASADMTEFGIDVTVLSGPDRGVEGNFLDGPELGSATVVSVPSLVRRLSPVADIRALLWLTRWMRSRRPDVVHTHSSKAGVVGRIAAALAGVPCVHTVHGWGPLHSGSRLLSWAVGLLERVLATITTRLVVVSRSDLELGLDRRIAGPDRYEIIRSGVDVEAVRAAGSARDAVRAELRFGDRFVIGMVARLAHPKDQNTLIEAFARADIAESVLVLVGDGPARPDIEAVIERRGLVDRVQVLGGRADGAEVVAGFDVAVLCSRWEGMPRSVVEAAAAGVPVVATDVGGVGELIEPGTSGRLVAPADTQAMAAALVDCHRFPDRSALMATEARRRSSEFSSARMRQDLARLWSSIAGRSIGHPAERPTPSAAAR